MAMIDGLHRHRLGWSSDPNAAICGVDGEPMEIMHFPIEPRCVGSNAGVHHGPSHGEYPQVFEAS